MIELKRKVKEDLVTPVLSKYVLILPVMIKKPIEACIMTGLHNNSSTPSADATIHDEPWPLLPLLPTGFDPDSCIQFVMSLVSKSSSTEPTHLVSILSTRRIPCSGLCRVNFLHGFCCCILNDVPGISTALLGLLSLHLVHYAICKVHGYTLISI
jgi:hypothetical protein